MHILNSLALRGIIQKNKNDYITKLRRSALFIEKENQPKLHRSDLEPIKNAKHLYPNLHPCSLWNKRSSKPYKRAFQGRITKIYNRHYYQSSTKTTCYFLYARSSPHFNWPKPKIALSELVRNIKAGSSGFINKRKWMPQKFNWQEGFGAFSYAHSQFRNVINYIENQKAHHKKATFLEEYKQILNKFKVEYSNTYLFDAIQ